MIRYQKHAEIDKGKWDNCIRHAINGLPYAFSWWLDVVSPDWEALILDDYSAVMPLTWKAKLGIHYLYQPYFTQQLGIFTSDILSSQETNAFLSAIPTRFRYIDIQLNAGNTVTSDLFRVLKRANYTLDLTGKYINIQSAYHRNCRRNIQKALHAGFSVKQGPISAVFSHFVQRNLEQRLADPPRNLYPLLQEITQASMQHKYGEILGVFDRNTNLVAAGWFINVPGRCLFLVCASTAYGKENQSMHLLVDHAIRERAGTGIIFDFTGSEMPGVAYFNAGFGATLSTYAAIKRNHLPWLLRLIKR